MSNKNSPNHSIKRKLIECDLCGQMECDCATASMLLYPYPKLIGVGTYGCVFHPPLFSPLESAEKYNNNMDYVMKIYDPTEDDEKLFSERILKIDPSGEHFISLIGDPMHVNLNSHNLRDLAKIDFLRHNKNVRGFYLKYGGPNLFDISQKIVPSLTEVWEWVTYIFKGLKILHDNDIFHFDVKSDNIVIDPKDNKARLIDFGMAFDDIPKSKCELCYYYPPIINATSFNQDNIKQYDLVDELYDHFGYVVPLKGKRNVIYEDTTQPLIEEDPLGFYRYVYKYEPMMFYSDIVLPNRDKIDCFQLIHTIWKLKLFLQRPMNKKEKYIYKAFKKLFNQNINPNIWQCWNLTENLSFIEIINHKIQSKCIEIPT